MKKARIKIPKLKMAPVPTAQGDRLNRRISAKMMVSTLKKIVRVVHDPENIIPTVVGAMLMPKMASGDNGAIELFRKLNEKYGPEWISYDQYALAADQSIANDIDKVLAIKMMLIKDSFFDIPYVFEKIVVALSDDPIIENIPQTLSPEDMCYALLVANCLRPDKDVSEEVEAFIYGHLVDSGFCVMLYPFDIDRQFWSEDVAKITDRVGRHLFGDSSAIDEIVDDQSNRYVTLLGNTIRGFVKECGDGVEEVDVNQI